MLDELALNVIFFVRMTPFARCFSLRVFTLAFTVPLQKWGECARGKENLYYWVNMPTQCFVKIVDLKLEMG